MPSIHLPPLLEHMHQGLSNDQLPGYESLLAELQVMSRVVKAFEDLDPNNPILDDFRNVQAITSGSDTHCPTCRRAF